MSTTCFSLKYFPLTNEIYVASDIDKFLTCCAKNVNVLKIASVIKFIPVKVPGFLNNRIVDFRLKLK